MQFKNPFPPSVPFWLITAVGGALLGALAWWLLPAWVNLAIFLPFALIAMRRHRDAFAFAAAYQLAAMVHWPALAHHTIEAWGLWLISGLSTGLVWSLVPDRAARPVHQLVRLAIAWALTWYTPFGWMGAAHPALAWATADPFVFEPIGFFWMGLLYTVAFAAPFLDWFHDPKPNRLVTWLMEKSRPQLVALMVLTGWLFGSVDMPAVKGSVGAIRSSWHSNKTSEAERLPKLRAVITEMNKLNTERGAGILRMLLIAEAPAMPGTQSEQDLFALATQGQIGLVIQHPGRDHAVSAIQTAQDPQPMCGSNWLPAWAIGMVTDTPCTASRLVNAPIPSPSAAPLQVHILFPGDVLSPGYWFSFAQPPDGLHVWGLLAKLNQDQYWAQRTMAKHFNALSFMTGNRAVAALAN